MVIKTLAQWKTPLEIAKCLRKLQRSSGKNSINKKNENTIRYSKEVGRLIVGSLTGNSQMTI